MMSEIPPKTPITKRGKGLLFMSRAEVVINSTNVITPNPMLSPKISTPNFNQGKENLLSFLSMN